MTPCFFFSRVKSAIFNGFGKAGPVFGFGELLLFHQNGHELGQGGNLLVLHADDGQKLENGQEEKDRDTNQCEGVVLDA